MDKVTVSADALRQVLEALNGPGHHIRELQVIRNLPGTTNPINTLIDEFNAACDAHNQQSGSKDKENEMRNMSFALTTDQIRNRSKTVTRRVGWLFIKPGDMLRPVKKCMGLKPGEKIEPLCDPVRVVSVRRELLRWISDNPFGDIECTREGFPDMTPSEFVTMFCATHKGCTPETEVTRIEFEYVNDQELNDE